MSLLLFTMPSSNVQGQGVPEPKRVRPVSDRQEPKAGNLYALVVGIGKYRDANIAEIRHAVDDAKDFATLLKSQTKIFNKRFVEVLLNEQATNSDLEIKLSEFEKKAGENDTIVIFLSGHGFPGPDDPPTFYFAAYNVNVDHLEKSAVNMSAFLETAKKYKSPRVILFADACHAGGYLSGGKGTAKSHGPTVSRATRKFIDALQSSEGVAALLSCAPDQESWAFDDMKNSVFTHFLLKGLRGDADKNRDGYVHFLEAYEYALAKTDKYVYERNGRHQVPHLKTGKSVTGLFPLSLAEPRRSELERMLLQAAESGAHGRLIEILGDNANPNCRNRDNNTPLLLAAANGHLRIVEYLLDNGASIEDRNNKGDTALHAAAENGHVAVVELLLDNKADIESANGEDYEPLLLAAENGRLSVVKLLIENGANIRATNRYGSSALILASRFGYEDIVEHLLKKVKPPYVNQTDNSDRTALILAARYGNRDIVELLLANGAHITLGTESAEPAKAELNSKLMHAVLEGNSEEVKKLINEKADINAVTPTDDRPLTLAAALGRDEVVRLLLEAGADVNAKGGWQSTALKWAALNGHRKVVELLLSKGSDVDARDRDGATPLMYAATAGHKEVLDVLLSHGARVELRSEAGNTALILAAEEAQPEIVELLLKRGARIDDPNADGETALYVVCADTKAKKEAERRKIVELLLRNGAEINAKTDKHDTALHAAAKNGYADIARLLIANGAVVDARNKYKGFTPLMFAVRNAKVDVARLLLDNGAKPDIEDREGITPHKIASGVGQEMDDLFKAKVSEK